MLQSTIEKILPQLPGIRSRLGVEDRRDAFFRSEGVGEVCVNVGEIHWEGEYELRFDIHGVLKSVHRLSWFSSFGGNSRINREAMTQDPRTGNWW